MHFLKTGMGNILGHFLGVGWGRGPATPCASSSPCPSIFADYSFLIHHPVNRDDSNLLSHGRQILGDFSTNSSGHPRFRETVEASEDLA
jgi:hypothetical protein